MARHHAAVAVETATRAAMIIDGDERRYRGRGGRSRGRPRLKDLRALAGHVLTSRALSVTAIWDEMQTIGEDE